MLVLFALALPAIMLMAGLSIDVGNLYLQHRIAQNAADAAALAGVRCLYLQATEGAGSSKVCRPTDTGYTPNTAPALDAADAIDYWVWRNSYGGIISTVESKSWLLGDGTTSAITAANNTQSTSPYNASGVSVTAIREFSPYMIQAGLAVLGDQLPSNIVNASGEMIARATAQSKVGVVVSVDTQDAPLAACGNYMVQSVVGDTPTPGPTSTATTGPSPTPIPPTGSVTKSWVFASDAEGWSASTASGDATASHTSGDGDPASGSLQASITTANKSDTVNWTVSPGSWETLGVTPGDTVSSVQVSIKQHTPNFSRGSTTAGSNYWLVRLEDGSGNLIAELYPQQNVTATNAWTTYTGSAQSVSLSSSSALRVSIRARLETTGGSGPNVTMRWDTITLTIGTAAPTSTPTPGGPTSTPTTGPTSTPPPAYDILGGDGTSTPFYVPQDPSQYGLDFILQSSQMDKSQPDDKCPHDNGDSWKGKLDTSSGTPIVGVNTPVTDPETEGGNADADVGAVCTSTGQPAPTSDPSTTQCWIVMPIVIPGPSNGTATVVSFACFKVYDGGDGTQKWRGVLDQASECPPYGNYGFSWTKSSSTQLSRMMLSG